jgi:hypothetical protein
MLLYRIVDTNGLNEEWRDTAPAADSVAAQRLGITSGETESLRRRITVDPVVIRREGSRWRSRTVWNLRSGERAVRIYEMLKVDEAAYDH